MHSAQDTILQPTTSEAQWPILICLLGPFSLVKQGQPVRVRSGGKTEALLSALALRYRHGVARDALLQALWLDSHDLTLAGQALDSLVYSAQKLLGSAIEGQSPVLHTNGCYRLNVEAGVGVDIAYFDELAHVGDQQARVGNRAMAATAYNHAVQLYRGDLCTVTDVNAVVERERLSARHLSLLAYLADYHYGESDYTTCLDMALRLLAIDPCREDAHRVVMRCYVRRGERAQALRQYRLCVDILRSEFDATPESATTALFDQIRHDPGII